MGLLSEKLGLYAMNPEDPSTNLGSWSVLAEAWGSKNTDSGMAVNERLAMTVPAVQACVRVIAETIASNTPDVFEALNPAGRRLAKDHRLYDILQYQPNPQMSAFTFFETGQAGLSLWGNTFAEIQRDASNRVIALWPLPPGTTRPRTDAYGNLFYSTTYTPDGSERRIEPRNILHVPGLSYDGINGLSPITLARQAVGLALATEKFGSQFFGNGAHPKGILSTDGTLKDDQIKRTRESWHGQYGGENAHKIAVLDGGLKFQAMSIPPEDAQFLETRKFSVSDIARIFRVPLHMIGDLERSTNNNIEHQSIEFIRNTIKPIARRWEQEINRKLFAGTPFYAEFDTSDLLQGDFKSRQEGLAIQRQNGVISTDEWRLGEHMNPIGESEGGNKYIVQLNMQPLEKVGEEPATPDTAPADETPAAKAARLRKMARAIEKGATQ